MCTPQLNVNSINGNVAATRSCKPNPTLEQKNSQIRTATIAEQKYIIAGMVLAFSGDSAAHWMYPDPYQYLTHFPRFVQAFGGKAFVQETAYCIDGYSGAAL